MKLHHVLCSLYYMANPVPVLSLVLSRSGFCSTDRFHGNGPTRVFLFWSKAGKFNICNQDGGKKVWKLSFFTLKLPTEAKKIEFFSEISKMDEEDEHFLSASHQKCILLSGTECHIINYLLTKLARAVPGNIGPQSFLYGPRCPRSVLPRPRANIPQYSPRARLLRGYYFFKINTPDMQCNPDVHFELHHELATSHLWLLHHIFHQRCANTSDTPSYHPVMQGKLGLSHQLRAH